MRHWHIALRTLLRRPGFAVTAILMLTLGIGATTALFSLVDTVLLKPLPYPHSDRLVYLLEASPSNNKKDSLIAPARLEDWNRLSQAFESITGIYAENVTDTSGTEPERLAGRRVSPRYFEVYATPPLIGRTFTPDEEREGGPGAAVISYGLWTRRYGQDPGVLSKSLVLGGTRYAIVGVMPRDFAAPSTDLWVPAQINAFLLRLRDARFFSGIGRMKPGVTIEQAQADLARVQQRLGEQFPKTDKDWSAVVTDLKDSRVGGFGRPLLLVFAAVGLLLLITVSNIAGLTLAQLHRREREMAIRSSVGASRGQVVGMVMREVSIVALAGAALGAAGSAVAVNLMSKNFADLPRMSELAFDWRALVFAATAGLFAALIFGAIPAVQSTRADLAAILAESSRSVSGGRRLMQRALVVAQLALTVVLLSGAGLLLRSYYNLSRVDTGFSADHAVTFHVGAAWNEDRPRVGRMQQEIVAAIGRVPGVEAVGFANFLPATGATLNYHISLEGFSSAQDATGFPVGERSISDAYLRAMSVPLLSGQWCPATQPVETHPTPVKALVNHRFLDAYTRGESVVGRHYRFSDSGGEGEIVGIVGDVKEDGLAAAAAPYLYACLPAGAWPDPEYVVRTRGDTRSVSTQIRMIVHQAAPGRAIFGLKPLDSVIDDALEQPRLNSRFLSIFAAAAMLLASVGLYSLISLMVTARTREIGVRLALGAGKSQIMRLIFAGAGKLLVLGIVLGLALTFSAEKAIRSVLFGVSPLDVPTLAGALAVLLIVTGIAALLPARRAARIDPLEAIRIE